MSVRMVVAALATKKFLLVSAVGIAAIAATAFSATEITTLVVAATAFITSAFTGVVSVLTVLRTAKKVDTIDAKADVITGHVNSAAAASAAKIDGLQKELLLMRESLAERKETAALLAQGVATAATAEASLAQARAVTEALHATPETK